MPTLGDILKNVAWGVARIGAPAVAGYGGGVGAATQMNVALAQEEAERRRLAREEERMEWQKEMAEQAQKERNFQTLHSILTQNPQLESYLGEAYVGAAQEAGVSLGDLLIPRTEMPAAISVPRIQEAVGPAAAVQGIKPGAVQPPVTAAPTERPRLFMTPQEREQTKRQEYASQLYPDDEVAQAYYTKTGQDPYQFITSGKDVIRVNKISGVKEYVVRDRSPQVFGTTIETGADGMKYMIHGKIRPDGNITYHSIPLGIQAATISGDDVDKLQDNALDWWKTKKDEINKYRKEVTDRYYKIYNIEGMEGAGTADRAIRDMVDLMIDKEVARYQSQLNEEMLLGIQAGVIPKEAAPLLIQNRPDFPLPKTNDMINRSLELLSGMKPTIGGFVELSEKELEELRKATGGEENLAANIVAQAAREANMDEKTAAETVIRLYGNRLPKDVVLQISEKYGVPSTVTVGYLMQTERRIQAEGFPTRQEYVAPPPQISGLGVPRGPMPGPQMVPKKEPTAKKPAPQEMKQEVSTSPQAQEFNQAKTEFKDQTDAILLQVIREEPIDSPRSRAAQFTLVERGQYHLLRPLIEMKQTRQPTIPKTTPAPRPTLSSTIEEQQKQAVETAKRMGLI